VSDFPSIGTLPEGTRALVLTISDGVAAGSRQDESGVALADRLARAGFRVDRSSVSDDRMLIEHALRDGATGHALIVSTGGTGLTPRDVTPQATLAVIDYEVPGLAEAMRAAGRAKTPMADLSRGVVGVIGKSLVVNVPGSPKAALESLAALEPTLAHALETLAGPFDHGSPARSSGSGLAATPASAPSALGASAPFTRPQHTAEAQRAPALTSPPPRADPNPDPNLGADSWTPIPDDNDEWRDLPGGDQR
jgi:molybdenum cofactor synthesis domain-containing protein